MPKTEIGSRISVPGQLSKSKPRFSGIVNQITLVMKLTILLLTTAVLSVNAEVTAQKVSISGNDLSLETVFAAIEKQTDYVVFSNRRDLADVGTISLDVSGMAMTELLDLVLKGTALEYTIRDKTIVLSRKVDLAHIIPLQPSDLRPVTIRVSGADGKPLAGASVFNRKTKKSGMTAADGTLRMDVNTGDVLEITYVGFEKQVITVDNKAETINVLLVTEENMLNEVVVNKGYYKEKKRLSTTNISRVTSKELEDQTVSSPLLALQGRMPGVDVLPANGGGGAPGVMPKIRIRGFNSLRYGMENTEGAGAPLFVVDGMIVGARPFFGNYSTLASAGYDVLSTMNMENIASIEVLKDADGTAIYGSRGANGVILITTKKNQQGKVSADLKVYHGTSMLANAPKLLETPEYLAMRKEAFANSNGTPDVVNAPDLTVWDQNKNTNWYKALYTGDAGNTDAQLNVSGGSYNLNFRAGVGYHREGSIYPGDFGFKRFTGNLSVGYISPGQRLKVNAVVDYGATNNKLAEGYGFFESVFLPPNAPDLLNENGSINWAMDENGNYTYNSNAMATLRNSNVSTMKNIRLSSQMSYKIWEGLEFVTTLGLTKADGDETLKFPLAALHPLWLSFSTGRVSYTVNKRSGWTVEPQLVYRRSLNDHHIEALVGTTFQDDYNERLTIDATGFQSDALMSNLRNAPVYSIPVDANSNYRYTALYGRIGYNWKEKYVLNLTGRRDGSSRFGDGNKFGNFGAIGAAWVISDENFIHNNIRFLSFAKLRSSYGMTGSDGIGDYKFYNAYKTTQFPYDGKKALAPFILYNPDYQWERTRKLEFGLDLGFLKDRIDLGVSYYRNRTDNQLVEYQLPMTSGLGSILRNTPAVVENRGWEFTLRTQNIDHKNFRWSTSFNVTTAINLLLKFDDLANSPYANERIVGEPIELRKVLRYLGVNPQTGLYEVEDVDGDGQISYVGADNVSLIRDFRGFFGGMDNSFNFHGIDLSFFFRFGSQNQNVKNVESAPGRGARNMLKVAYDNRWQKPGDDATVQKLSLSANRTYTQFANSDGAIGRVNFVRLQTAALGYHIPAKLTGRLGISHAKIYMHAQNLLTFCNYSHLMDPESPSLFNAPVLKSLTFGLNVNF